VHGSWTGVQHPGDMHTAHAPSVTTAAEFRREQLLAPFLETVPGPVRETPAIYGMVESFVLETGEMLLFPCLDYII